MEPAYDLSDPYRKEWKVGEHLDVFDKNGEKWRNGEVVKIEHCRVRIHFSGWGAKYDEWIDEDSDRL